MIYQNYSAAVKLVRTISSSTSGFLVKSLSTTSNANFQSCRRIMTQAGKTPKLFTGVKIGDFQLPHRVVLSPMTRFRADVSTQVPKPCVAEYYEQRASTSGLLITEATSIHEDAAPYKGIPGIYSEEQIATWSKVTDRVHGKGGKIFVQLWHIGRLARSCNLPGNKQPVSSSAIPFENVKSHYHSACGGVLNGEVPRVLSLEEITEIVGQYRQAAANAKRAGFDGVEVQCGGGYLIDQFLEDGVNKRQDAYGGSIEKRCRFALEIIDAVSKEIGQPKVGLRLSPFGTFQDMNDTNSVALFTHLLRQLTQNHPNLAYVHFNDFTCTPEERKLMCGEIRQAWTGKCILNRYNLTRDEAIEHVEDGRVDLIAIGRDFLANPDLPERLKKNLKLNEQDVATFYTQDEAGYIDYPFYSASQK